MKVKNELWACAQFAVDRQDGIGEAAHFDSPSSLALSPDGKTLFVNDYSENEDGDSEGSLVLSTCIHGSIRGRFTIQN